MSDEPTDVAVGRFKVLGAYGEVMLGFQLLELDFWALLLMQQKAGMSFDQRVDKLENLDRASMGRLLRGIREMPEALCQECLRAIDARKYLAHRWLRDRAIFFSDPRAGSVFGEELAEVGRRLDDLATAMRSLMQERGVPEVSDEDLDQLGLEEPPSLDSWLQGSSLSDDDSR